MKVFKVSDGTSWTARLEAGDDAGDNTTAGWEAVVFDASPHAVAQRLVYRPAGWFETATPGELAAALEESVAVRVRWGT
ncbi:MAG TPA: hypothetical protein VK929_01390 [Longimicrobiales bacterium]|nr:hypothetical protein [Longimicrobiales bacterium]